MISVTYVRETGTQMRDLSMMRQGQSTIKRTIATLFENLESTRL